VGWGWGRSDAIQRVQLRGELDSTFAGVV
jgi:hypothetical protein